MGPALFPDKIGGSPLRYFTVKYDNYKVEQKILADYVIMFRDFFKNKFTNSHLIFVGDSADWIKRVLTCSGVQGLRQDMTTISLTGVSGAYRRSDDKENFVNSLRETVTQQLGNRIQNGSGVVLIDYVDTGLSMMLLKKVLENMGFQVKCFDLALGIQRETYYSVQRTEIDKTHISEFDFVNPQFEDILSENDMDSEERNYYNHVLHSIFQNKDDVRSVPNHTPEKWENPVTKIRFSENVECDRLASKIAELVKKDSTPQGGSEPRVSFIAAAVGVFIVLLASSLGA